MLSTYEVMHSKSGQCGDYVKNVTDILDSLSDFEKISDARLAEYSHGEGSNPTRVVTLLDNGRTVVKIGRRDTQQSVEFTESEIKLVRRRIGRNLFSEDLKLK